MTSKRFMQINWAEQGVCAPVESWKSAVTWRTLSICAIISKVHPIFCYGKTLVICVTIWSGLWSLQMVWVTIPISPSKHAGIMEVVVKSIWYRWISALFLNIRTQFLVFSKTCRLRFFCIHIHKSSMHYKVIENQIQQQQQQQQHL